MCRTCRTGLFLFVQELDTYCCSMVSWDIVLLHEVPLVDKWNNRPCMVPQLSQRLVLQVKKVDGGSWAYTVGCCAKFSETKSDTLMKLTFN